MARGPGGCFLGGRGFGSVPWCGCMNRDEIALILERIALLLELKGENAFKLRAYRNGAAIVRSHPEDVAVLAREGRLDGIPGLGETRRKRLLKELGSLKKVREASVDDLRALTWLPDSVADAVYAKLHDETAR